MHTITIVDTGYSTNNIGDEIIMDAVNATVLELFPDAYIYRVASHEPLSPRAHRFIREADLCFIGGTNLLSSKMSPRGLWQVSLADAEQYELTPTVTLGTGWERRVSEITPFSRNFLQRSLSPQLVHSVRDSFARAQLDSIGIRSLNTSCPTTWALTPGHCAGVGRERANAVLLSHTAWLPALEDDAHLVRLLLELYDQVYFFPQMREDLEYAKAVFWDDKIEVVPPNLASYDAFLRDTAVDYVGTRLHGGIRALQHGRRALILAVDHRAAEIARDTGLPVVGRDETRAVRAWVETCPPLAVHLPDEAIAAWKRQFASESLEEVLDAARKRKAGYRSRISPLARLRSGLRKII